MSERKYQPTHPSKEHKSRENEVIETIKDIEAKFMEALKRRYGDQKGWRMCGAASVALSRILSARTGIPIGKKIHGEHIELEVGIFDPDMSLHH